MFVSAILVLLTLFAAAMIERNRLRSHWWAWRLTQTDDPRQQAYYLASLAAVGDSAIGAVDRLAHDEEPLVRSLAVVALAALPDAAGMDGLGGLLSDPDAEVRASASLCLAFLVDDPEAGPQALGLLHKAAGQPETGPALAATAALSHVSAPDALKTLGHAAATHPSAWVRAQAVESLAAITSSLQAPPNQPTSASAEEAPTSDRRFPQVGSGDVIDALAASLLDEGRFTGTLALEQEIERAAAFAAPSARARPSAADPIERTVANIAAAGLSALTGRRIEPADGPAIGTPTVFAARCREWIIERRKSADGESDAPH